MDALGKWWKLYAANCDAMTNAEFADALRAERARIGLSQADAAGLLSLSPRAYQYWEDGRREASILEVAQEGALYRLTSMPPAKRGKTIKPQMRSNE